VPEFPTSGDDARSPPEADEAPPTAHETDTNSEDRVATLDARLAALERAVADGETDLHALAEPAARAARLDDLESRLGEVETRLDELDAAVQALRGYVGAVRAVNRDVERRADAALSAVDRLADTEQVSELDLPETSAPASSEPTTGDDGDLAGSDEATARASTGTDDEADGETTRDDDFADRVRDLW
jgi:uncharacterized coiled-coil protein SlyX